MDKQETLNEVERIVNKINYLHSKIEKLQLDLIESEAIKILIADPNLNEFVMGMGTCFFTCKEGGSYDIDFYTNEELLKLEEKNDPLIDIICFDGNVMREKFQKEFFDMIENMNDEFNIKGCPMRFTANSSVITMW